MHSASFSFKIALGTNVDSFDCTVEVVTAVRTEGNALPLSEEDDKPTVELYLNDEVPNAELDDAVALAERGVQLKEVGAKADVNPVLVADKGFF